MGESLKVTTAYDGSAIEAGLRKTGEYAQSFGNSISGKILGAFTAGAVANRLVSVFTGVFDKVNQLSDQKELFGMSAESLQVLQKAASHVGLELDDLSVAFNSLTKIKAAAIQGDEESISKLRKYGLTLSDINGETENSIELFKKMGAAMDLNGNGALARAGLMEDFGKGGIKLGAMAKDLNEGTTRPTFSNEEVEDLERIRRNSVGFWASMGNLVSQITAEMVHPSVYPYMSPKPGPFLGPFQPSPGASPRQSDKEVKESRELSALYEAGIKMQFEKLGPLAKERDMKREIAALDLQINEANHPGSSSEERLAKEALEFERNKKLLELKNFQGTMQQESGPYKLNALQAQGAYVGGYGNDNGKRAIKLLETIAQNTQKNADKAMIDWGVAF